MPTIRATTRGQMAEQHSAAFVSAPGEGRTVRPPVGESLTFKARDEQTGGALTAFESAPGPAGMEVLGPPLAQTHSAVDADRT